MISLRISPIVLGTCLLLATRLAADQPTVPAAKMENSMTDAKMAMMTPGLQVGAKAPDFLLKDASGKDVSLKSLLAQGKVALAFYRSADWCPYCLDQMKDLQANLMKIHGAGVQLVGISYDSSETLGRVVAKHGFTFPLLADVDSKTIDAYGIRNQKAKGRAEGVAHPVLFIVDQQGFVRAKLMRDNYKERPEVDEIIAAAQGVM